MAAAKAAASAAFCACRRLAISRPPSITTATTLRIATSDTATRGTTTARRRLIRM